MYRWNPGYRIAYLGKVKPEVFAQHMTRLQERSGGEIAARDVVEAARPEGSEIHALFEWQDSEAAEQYRIHQARNALHSLRIVRITAEGPQEERIAYIHIQEPEAGRHVYVSAATVALRSDYQEQAVEEALRYLNGFQRRYKHLQALEPLFEAVEQALEQHDPRTAKVL